MTNATDRLQIEQTAASTLKMTVEELEDVLQEKSRELIAVAQKNNTVLMKCNE
ncbi:unnamed protein product [Gongylonema pulchrum]|uniref:Uncharacterized protein n=1 Tax=Gongylonema pulchrum TaxID=637853 RepID=A0A3P6UU71_9BILA|nr:unnamed protein product [Gongylonema pulchrum]